MSSTPQSSQPLRIASRVVTRGPDPIDLDVTGDAIAESLAHRAGEAAHRRGLVLKRFEHDQQLQHAEQALGPAG
jgi:hypothetical protein